MGSCYRWSQIHSTVQREAEPCYNLGWHRQATRATVGKAIEGSFPALLLRDKWRPERWFLKYTRGSQVETEQSLQQEEELRQWPSDRGRDPHCLPSPLHCPRAVKFSSKDFQLHQQRLSGFSELTSSGSPRDFPALIPMQTTRPTDGVMGLKFQKEAEELLIPQVPNSGPWRVGYAGET